MADTKKRKGSIREEDVLVLLNKYSPTAILNLLKEVAQFAGVKIDWNTLVKRSTTGISSAREYQMLWRHLAYRDPLLEKLEAGAEPLDDDSDLEFELEAFPAVSGETSAEAATCVKRWSIIRKKRANLSAGSGCNPVGSAPTEAHMATWQAVNMAIKMPIIGGISARRPGSTGALQSTDAGNSSAPSVTASEATTPSAPEVPNQSCQPNNQTISQKGGTLTAPSKSRANPKMPTIPVKPLGGPNSIIQAAAFAAGGRIATPSTAASHFKAAQSKNAVHIRPGSTPPSSTTSGSKSLSSMTTLGPQPSNIRCSKTPISPKDPVMTPIGSRTTSHQGMCSSSDQLSPCNATPSNQPTEQVQIQMSSASPACADAHGNGESRCTSAILDTSGEVSMEDNKGAGEIKLDSPESHGQVDFLTLDVDSEKAGVDQIDDSRAAADSQIAGLPEIALNKSDSPCVDTTEKAVAAVKTGDVGPREMTPGMRNGEITKNQVAVDMSTEKGNVTENEIHDSDAVAIVAEETETLEETVSQNPMPDDDGAVRD